jgi:hypothetical protein
MAKTNTVQVHRSTTASAVPGASALAAGELAVNLTDKKLFVGDAAGTSHVELTRLAAAASSAGALKLQLADTNGYLTGPSGTLYYDPAQDRLVATSMEFGSTVFYSSDNDRIMEAGGNPSRRIHIRQVSGGDIHIGDSGLEGNTTIGFSVQENNLAMYAYGDVYIEPDAGANTTGDLNTRTIRIRDASELRFGDSDDSNYVGFKAPATVSADKIWTLPSADGTSGQVLSTNGSGTLSWATAGGGGTKTYAVFTPLDNQPPASNFATLDTRNSIAVLDFDASTDESAVFVGVMPEGASLGSGLKIRINWMATSATSGACRWGVQIERMNTDEDSDSFDTAATGGSTTSGTSGIITTTEITVTTIDSVAAGEPFRLKVYRDADGTSGTDDMTGDAELVSVEVRSAS